ncbi:MAG: DNA helicase RecQ [Bacillota bacterium]|nr:DNA helicase RecQ [Bacillota bacterium]
MDRKHEILHQYFGYPSFRGGQEALIDAQLAGRDAFGVMPTGGGKSLCYQIPALLLEGITLVISPLISLMKDQVMALKKSGVPAAYINSSLSPDQIRLVYQNLLAGQYRLVYIAPERLLTEGFLSVVRRVKIALVAVDEAHCISQWGQDFRPSYLRIVDFLGQLEDRPVVSAFTATATQQVQEDVARILGLRDPLRVVTGFDRPNLRFEVRRPQDKNAALLSLLADRPHQSGIVYCAARREVETVCQMLRDRGIAATRYHGGLSESERRVNQEDFIYDRRTVMVATNAFGMGIDKSNVTFVIHYAMPQSMEAYYQEAGRAGRDGGVADCILLYAPGDIRTAKYLIEHPSEQETLSEEERRRVVEQGLARLEQMIGYCKTTDCLRGYILDYFGQAHEAACGNCGNCTADFAERDITRQAQMILSCVKRISDHLGYSLGATGVMQTLRGSKNKRILSLGLDTISTYGLMRDTSRQELQGMIDSLENQGYLRTHVSHGGLMLTERAGAVLFRNEPVSMAVRRRSEAVRAPERRPRGEEGLITALKALRLRLAKEEKVPAYIVFTNAALEDMAAREPVTMEEFLTVSGVGSHKAQRYGEAFLAEIQRYREGRGER